MAQVKKTQGITPIEIFNRAHARSEVFISGGKGNKGRRDADDLRAAVVFAVAAIDAYFRFKIIDYWRKKRTSNGSNYKLSSPAEVIVKRAIAKKLFNTTDIKKISKNEKEAVYLIAESNKPSVINYLEQALQEISFQNVKMMDEAISMMGFTPQEIWGRAQSDLKSKKSLRKQLGRPVKNKRGKKAEIRVQLENLFLRRHIIVHEADIILRSKQRKGKERGISYTTVKKWVSYAKKAIYFINSELK